MSQLRLVRSAGERRPAEAPLHVETITDEQALIDLEPIWNSLLEESGVDHPFLSHEWFRTWWECFGEGHDLHVLMVKEGNRPVALVPLMRTEGRVGGLWLRRLEIIGNVHTQRFDVIVNQRGRHVYGSIWDAIRSQKRLWDVLVLSHLPAGSPTLAWLSRLARRDGFLTGVWRSRSPYLRIAGSWPSYFRELPSKHRANLRRRAKRLERLGEVRTEVVRSGREISGALQEGLQLEAAGWKGRAGTAILSDPATRRFYFLLAQRAARRGWLRLNFLRSGGRRVAFDFSLNYANKAYLLKTAYDPGFASCSPYNQLLVRALRDHFENGTEEFDFLGHDDDWKYEWAVQTRPHDWLYVMPATPRMRLLRFVKFRLIPGLKRYRWFDPVRDAALSLLGAWNTRRRRLPAVGHAY